MVEAGAIFKNYKSNIPTKNPTQTKKDLATKTNKQTNNADFPYHVSRHLASFLGRLYLATAPLSGNVEELGPI